MLDHVSRVFKALQGLRFYDPTSNDTIPHQFEKHAIRHPRRTFLLFEDEAFNYEEANELVNRHVDAYKQLGIGKGDVVALVLVNRPEFYWHFLALGKLGAVVSLINTHAEGGPLAHAIRICNPKHIVVGSEVWEAFERVRGQLAEVASGVVDIDVDRAARVRADVPLWQDRLPRVSAGNPPETSQHTLHDLAAYIYTSGTTGMPKAALVKHQRLYRGGRVWGGAAWMLRKGDVLYCSLPLYHSNGIILATSSAITFGVTIALARRFSASRFWEDCRKHGATCFVYIGELCRYLMNAPPSPDDRNHQIRAISGNGLRPDIWEAFQQRFGIKRIAEFYGSTEGNVQTINLTNTVGSVGRMMGGCTLARWDEDKDDFVRDANGHLVRCRPGEPGILLGAIRAKAEFDGYRDRAATEKKILRNAFGDGVDWFNTNDLLRADSKKNLYFVDRLGDTFRWKGENVSTFEVQEQISKWPRAREVNVYGVPVHHTEGRAGMASVVLDRDSDFDPDEFKEHVDSVLPGYARPLFVRVSDSMDTTGTLKLKKNDLQKEGFDPDKAQDPIYFRHPERDEYVKMSEQLYEDVVKGRLPL